MRPKILVIFLVLISVSILHSCGEDGNSPSDDGFSLDLTVVGTDGSPMGNLVISRLDHLDFLYLAGDTPRPTTMEIANTPVSVRVVAGDELLPPPGFLIHPAWPNPCVSSVTGRLDIPVACDLEFEYTDWDGDVMWHGGWEGLTENSQFYTVWNVRDYFQNPVPNGIYGATYTAYEPGTDEEIFKGTAWFAVWTDMDMYAASIGVTGPDGSFTTRNKELFGFLQGHQPMTSTDGVGVGADFGFSPAVTFVATTPPPPGGTGYIYWMRREVTLIDGPNDFEWVFVPDDSVFVAPDAQ